MLNVDCMEYLKDCQDDEFDLAIVDPPYGHGNNLIQKGNTRSNIVSAGKYRPYDNSSSPDPEYFEQLIRVSKNQIIWGANHFADKFDASGSGWIVWYKRTSGDFADCELAYSSFDRACRCFDYMWNGMHQGSVGGDVRRNEKRIHPTQKPVKLYQWLLKNYANEGDRILDTHMGSGSSAIAAHLGGFEFVGCEISEEYFSLSKERYQNETRQMVMEL